MGNPISRLSLSFRHSQLLREGFMSITHAFWHDARRLRHLKRFLQLHDIDGPLRYGMGIEGSVIGKRERVKGKGKRQKFQN